MPEQLPQEAMSEIYIAKATKEFEELLRRHMPGLCETADLSEEKSVKASVSLQFVFNSYPNLEMSLKYTPPSVKETIEISLNAADQHHEEYREPEAAP